MILLTLHWRPDIKAGYFIGPDGHKRRLDHVSAVPLSFPFESPSRKPLEKTDMMTWLRGTRVDEGGFLTLSGFQD